MDQLFRAEFMSDRKNSCWYDDDETPKKMLEGARGELFPTLENSDHWPVLSFLLNKCEGAQSILDVGCGAAALSQLVEWVYTGCDLPHIIEKVAKIHTPTANLHAFDFYKDDLQFMNQHDVIVANAFIDVLDDPVDSLSNLMDVTRSYLIVHRQRITEGNSGSEKVDSYTGFSYSSMLSLKTLHDLCKEKNFNLQWVVPWSAEYYSFLLKKA